MQALAFGDRAFSLQYHVELTSTTVDEWAAVPEYAASLAATLGEDALPRFKAETAANMADFIRDARMLYDNLMKVMAAN